MNEAFINKTKTYRYRKLTCREESAAFGDEKEESLAWHYDPRDFSLRPRERYLCRVFYCKVENNELYKIGVSFFFTYKAIL
jgi:hypothetical protein